MLVFGEVQSFQFYIICYCAITYISSFVQVNALYVYMSSCWTGKMTAQNDHVEMGYGMIIQNGLWNGQYWSFL